MKRGRGCWQRRADRGLSLLSQLARSDPPKNNPKSHTPRASQTHNTLLTPAACSSTCRARSGACGRRGARPFRRRARTGKCASRAGPGGDCTASPCFLRNVCVRCVGLAKRSRRTRRYRRRAARRRPLFALLPHLEGEHVLLRRHFALHHRGWSEVLEGRVSGRVSGGKKAWVNSSLRVSAFFRASAWALPNHSRHIQPC